MRAAQHRHLTPWLIAACVLALLALVALALGIGRHVHWGDSGTPAARLPAAQAAVSLPPAPPLQHYAEIWRRPLFSNDRRPAPTTPGDASDGASLGDLELTGIIISPSLRMAMLRNRKSGDEVRVREGDGVAGGRWTLQALAPRSATFVGAGGRTVLPLKVAAHIDRGETGTHPAKAPPGNDSAGMVRVGMQPRASAAGQPPLTMQSASSVHEPTAAQIQAGNAQKARIKALRKRIEDQRHRQPPAAHDGDH